MGISHFSEDTVLETGCDLDGISVHDGSKSDTDSDYNLEPQTSQFFILQSKEQSCSYTSFEIVINYKAYNYYKVVGETC